MNIIEHHEFLTTKTQLLMEMGHFRPGHMIFLMGPSGVGKTTLRHAAMQATFGNPLLWGRGKTPAIECFVVLPQIGFFSSAFLADEMIDQLNAPSLNWLFENSDIPLNVEGEITANVDEAAKIWPLLKRSGMSERDLWKTFKRTVKERGCKYVSLDQVTGLLVNRKNKKPSDHIEHLMSLGEACGIMFIMTGVARASELWSIHSELRRRVIPVWMSPYSEHNKGDLVHYLQLLKTLSGKYPLSKNDLLYTMATDIYAMTGGTIGEIVKLMQRAAVLAAMNGDTKLKKEHIQRASYNEKDLRNLWGDIKEFEIVKATADSSLRSEEVAARWSLNKKATAKVA
ncbi:ATP-binding protein [Dyella dinghuensis]|nr:ATP-binding protein [Dyella dinghuensis]